MNKTSLNEMFEKLLHIGNKTTYWNPKMKSYIHASTNGVHVINLVKTSKKIEDVKAILEAHTNEGKTILFVATKLQGRDSFSKLAEETGHHFVTEKWVPGLLTNFKTIKKRIATYMNLLKESTNGGFDMLTKKEKAAKLLELEKLDRAFRGLKKMRTLPDMVFIVDGAYEEQVSKEAGKLGIKVISMLNTNGNPDSCTDFIPVNTNAVKSLDYIATALKGSIKPPKTIEKKSGFKKPQTGGFQRRVAPTKRIAPKTEDKVQVKAEGKSADVEVVTKKEEK